MWNSAQKRWLSVMGVSLLVCSPSLLGAQGQQSSSPPAATTETAVIAALGGIVAVLISSVTAVIVARITSRKEIEKVSPISLEELLKKIDDIKDKGRFVSEGEVLEKLIQCAASDKDKLFPKFRRMVLDKSRVAQMIEMTPAEQVEITKLIFRELSRLKPPP